MLPGLLLQLGPLPVYSFGLILAVTFVLGVFLFWRAATREGFASDPIFNPIFLSTVFALAISLWWWLVPIVTKIPFSSWPFMVLTAHRLSQPVPGLYLVTAGSLISLISLTLYRFGVITSKGEKQLD